MRLPIIQRAPTSVLSKYTYTSTTWVPGFMARRAGTACPRHRHRRRFQRAMRCPGMGEAVHVYVTDERKN